MSFFGRKTVTADYVAQHFSDILCHWCSDSELAEMRTFLGFPDDTNGVERELAILYTFLCLHLLDRYFGKNERIWQEVSTAFDTAITNKLPNAISKRTSYDEIVRLSGARIEVYQRLMNEDVGYFCRQVPYKFIGFVSSLDGMTLEEMASQWGGTTMKMQTWLASTYNQLDKGLSLFSKNYKIKTSS